MINRPKPDWGRKGTQPVGTLGAPPPPNGRLVATRPQDMPPPGPSNKIYRTPNPWPVPDSRDKAVTVVVDREDLGRILGLAHANWKDRYSAPIETQEAYYRLVDIYRKDGD